MMVPSCVFRHSETFRIYFDPLELMRFLDHYGKDLGFWSKGTPFIELLFRH